VSEVIGPNKGICAFLAASPSENAITTSSRVSAMDGFVAEGHSLKLPSCVWQRGGPS
jgi:hypothetical protein